MEEKESECKADELEDSEDLVVEIQGETGFEIKDRSYFLRTFKDCFVGKSTLIYHSK